MALSLSLSLSLLELDFDDDTFSDFSLSLVVVLGAIVADATVEWLWRVHDVFVYVGVKIHWRKRMAVRLVEPRWRSVSR